MTLADITDPAAVTQAMEEFQTLGRAGFLERYGFGTSRQYVIVAHGRRYDAKALVGAAHGFQHPGLGPLEHAAFSGGVAGANAVLKRLGFEVVNLDDGDVTLERRWRDEAFQEAAATGEELTPELLRELGLYGGAQGVWVDKERTQVFAPEGVAVSVLHTGRHYADDLDNSGVVYHYPATRRPASRDANEIQAVKNAGRLQLPIFVVSESGPGGRRRLLRRGWVVDHDDQAQVFLIEFSSDPLPVPTIPEVQQAPFDAQVRRRRVRSEVERLERDPKFKFQVLRRYGGACVLSGMSVAEMLDAAHVIPVEDGGSDDERNGLLLSAGLHRAFDAGLWAIDPSTLAVVTRPQGPSCQAMGIAVTSLETLELLPHAAALEWRYRRWLQRNGLTGGQPPSASRAPERSPPRTLSSTAGGTSQGGHTGLP